MFRKLKPSALGCGLLALLSATPVLAIGEYIPASLYLADWIPVNEFVKRDFVANTSAAGQEIVAATAWLNPQGPWSVMNKTLLPPSGDIHDYYSLSPYWWPDCSNVHNTTQLTEQQISEECDYVDRDGQFNPDRTMVNDTTEFATLAATVHFDIMAWRITGDESYANYAASFIDTWFLNNATSMNPNLEYSQVIRGPTGSKNGTHEGILDLHCMTKIASAIVIMRQANATAWTPARDAAMIAWSQEYIAWLTSNPISLGEKAATNNHGSFWAAQVAAMYIIVNDLNNATATLKEYFAGIYQNQIIANGDQPLEAARTLPFHYRSYNAGAIVVISRMAEFLGWNSWNITTAAGTTIQNAVDFIMALNLTDQDSAISEVFPSVAAVASQYGDPSGKYSSWLAQQDPVYPGEAWFMWDQPLTNSGINVTVNATGDILLANASASGSSGSGHGSKSSANNITRPPWELAATTFGILFAALWFIS